MQRLEAHLQAEVVVSPLSHNVLYEEYAFCLCIVTYYDYGTPKEGDLYNLKKAAGNDAYEIFLSGAAPVVTIENPDAVSGKALVIFRDSFGSSIAPLLVSGYEKITLVDIRYVQSSSVGEFVDFSGCNVLFLYSTILLNNSGALR